MKFWRCFWIWNLCWKVIQSMWPNSSLMCPLSSSTNLRVKIMNTMARGEFFFFHNLFKNFFSKIGESLAVATATIAHRMKTLFCLGAPKRRGMLSSNGIDLSVLFIVTLIDTFWEARLRGKIFWWHYMNILSLSFISEITSW